MASPEVISAPTQKTMDADVYPTSSKQILDMLLKYLDGKQIADSRMSDGNQGRRRRGTALESQARGNTCGLAL